MAEGLDVVNKFKSGLDPYIKPREQANFIRRILSLHLGACSSDAPLNKPLALASYTSGVASHDVGTHTKGLHQDYLDALRDNAAARQRFDDVVQQRPGTPEQQPAITGYEKESILDERLAILKLQKKREKLSTVRRYLDHLAEEPAASPAFLDPDQILREAKPLPAVPRDVVDSIAADPGESSQDLRARATSLEKIVLRARLLLKQEEKLLEEAKARSRHRPEVTSHGARVEALNATRSELITWIESELSVATDEKEQHPEHHDSNTGDPELDQATISAGLAEIRDKYAKYVDSRSELLALVAQRLEQPTTPDLKPKITQSSTGLAVQPINYHLIPYIENLLVVSRNQKSLISQKSHLNSSLGKQAREARQGLGHLAEESQLLPAYPMKESLRRRSGLVSELTSKKSDKPDMSKRIKPWVFASDSAKIANLESVAETVESGQLALEGSMEALQELEDLLGLKKSEPSGSSGEGPVEGLDDSDVWLAAEDAKDTGRMKHTEKQIVSDQRPGDIWSALHGNLGLIGQEEAL